LYVVIKKIVLHILCHIREKQTATTESYSNDLHEALLKKNGTAFWRCWRSNFESKSKCSQVEGCIDPDVIADKFAERQFHAVIPTERSH